MNGKGESPKRPRNGGAGNVRPYFTTRNGRKVWAKDYGYKGWPIGRRK
ncbi:MAG: hypothetical protein WD069_06100 [Planctomycetales bacterium]